MKKLYGIYQHDVNFVYKMRDYLKPYFRLVGLVFTLLVSVVSWGQTNTWDGSSSNNWNTAANWSLNHVPTSGEDVVIPNNFNVSINTAAVCKSLTISGGNQSNTVTINNGNSLTVSQDISIGAGTGNNDNKTLVVGANTLSCRSIFLAATGSNNITSSLTISTGTVNVANDITFGDTQDKIVFSNTGVLNIGGNFGDGGTFTCSTSTVNYNGTTSNQTIGAYTYYNLVVSGSGNKTSSSSAFTVSNNLTVNSVNLVLQATNSDYAVAGNLTVDATGTLTHSVDWATGRMLRVGGNISIDGSYDYSAVSRAHIQMYGSNKTIRTGTTGLSILTLLTNGAITANGPVIINDNFWAMYGTTGSFSTGSNTVTAQSSLLVNGGTVNVQNGGTLNVTGGITVGTTGSNGIMTLVAGGTLTTDGLTLGDGTRTGAFTHSGGTANINGDLLIRPSCTYTCSGSPLINVSGNFTNNGIFTTASSTVVLNGGSAQTIGGVSATTIYNLTLNKSDVASLAGALNVSNTLNLTSGILQLGGYTFTMTGSDPTGKITGSFGSGSMIETNGTGYFVVNNVNSSRPNISFPIGSGGYYAPLNVVTTGSATGASISVRTIKQTINGNFVGRYWDVVSSAGRTATLQFTYDASEANGNPANYTTWTKTGAGSWQLSTGTTTLGANTFTVAGVANNIGTAVTSFTAGAIGTYYSYQSGSWNNPLTWTTDPGGTTQVGTGVPGENDVVVILTDREVSLPATVSAANLDVSINESGVLNMGAYAFSSGLKALRGTGLLKLASASFPTATTNTFVQTGGGTTEYTAALTLPSTQATYNNLNVSASGVVLQTSDIALNGNLTVKSGTYQINDATTQRLKLTVEGSIVVNNGASLTTGSGNTTSGGSLTGGTAPYSNYYDTYSHRVVVKGDFTNNGTVRFTNQAYPTYTSYPTNGFATVYFTGATDNTVYCNGQTDFHNLVLDKGTDQTFKLTVQSTAYTNFRLFGRNDLDGLNAGANPDLRKALWIRTGTLVLRGLLVIPTLSEGGGGSGDPNSDFYIPANAALVLDGPEVVVLATADDYREVNVAFNISGGSNAIYGVNKGVNASSFSIYGRFQINNGYFSTRESGGFITWDLTSGQFIMNGGTVDAKQFRAAGGASGLASYEQSGGTLILRGRFQRIPTQYTSVADLKVFTTATMSTVRTLNGLDDTKGTLNINATANVFNMSGGTIRIYDVCGTNPYAVDIFAAANNISVTGGTFEIISTTGTAYADADYTIRSNAPLGNLVVSRTSGTKSTLLNNSYPLTVVQNLDVLSGVLNTQNTNVTVGGNITFATGATYTAGTNTTTLNGADDQTFTVNLASALQLQNLKIEKEQYFYVNFAGTQKTINVAGDFTLEKGELLDNGTVFNVAGNVYNTGTYTGTGRIHLNGSALQTIGGSGRYGNLTLQNTNAASAPVSLSSDLIVDGVLTFNNNKLLNIDNYNLRLTQNASVVGHSSTRYITTDGASGNGGVTKVFNTNDAFVFPVGVGGYTPVSFKVDGTPNSYGDITVVPVAYAHPNVTAPNRSLTYFWRVKSTGFDLGAATVSHSYTYLPSSVVTSGDVTESGYVPARYNQSTLSWEKGATSDMDVTNHIIGGAFLTNVGFIDGDYTAGDDSPTNPFGTIKKYYSRVASGNWSDVNTWSTEGHTGAAASVVPTTGDAVVIGAGHTITLTANAFSGSLQIEAGGVLDIQTYTGSNFGMVLNHSSGNNGKIRVKAVDANGANLVRIFSFPSGDFTDFNTSKGNTEFYSTTNNANYVYILPSNVTSYGNLILSPNGLDNLSLPNNAKTTIYGDLTLNSSNYNSWIAMSWNTTRWGNNLFNPTIEKTVHVKGNTYVNGGSLAFMDDYQPQHLVIDGDLVVANSTNARVITIASGWLGGGVVANSLTIGGSLINNNYVSLDNTKYVNLRFVGDVSSSITNTAGTPTTILKSLTVNKGTSQAIKLTCNIGGTLTTPTNGWLTIQNGTFEYVRTGNLPITTTDAFTIPSTGGLLVNTSSQVLIGNSNSNTNDLYLNGKLTILNGDVYVGPTGFPSNNNDIEYSAGGSAEIELTGGRLFVNGQIRRNPATSLGVLMYSQSGSSQVMILGNNANTTNAKLEIVNSGSSFAMSGSSKLIIVRGGGTTFGDLYLRPETSSVTGGEILFSQSPSGITAVDAAQSYVLDATCALNKLTITGKTSGTARTATVKLLISPLVLNGDMVLSNTQSYFDANTSYNIPVTIKGDLDNNGTYNHYNNTTTFSGGVQTIKGNTLTDFYDLVISPVTSLTVIRNVTVVRNATIGSGTLLLNTFTMGVGGNLTNNSTYTTTTGALSLNGSSAVQQITGTGTFGRLEINNAYGARLNNDVTLQGNLKFTQGVLNINQYLLTLGASTAIEGTPDNTKMVVTDGVYSNFGVKKVFNASYTGNYTIPVGAAGKYTPAKLTVTANSGGAGYIQVIPVNSMHPSTLSPYRVLNYYWDVRSSGLSGITGNLQLTYNNNDVLQAASDESSYVAARLLVPGTSWSKASAGADNVTEASDLITFSYSGSNDLSGEYTAGIDSDIPDNIPVYRTVKDGLWDDPTVWEQVGVYNPALPEIPNGFVVIIDHVIDVNVPNIFAYRTTINGKLKFLSGIAGHNIGNILGTGTLYVESGTFPAGRYTDFFDCANSGILEYGGDAKTYTLSATLYNSAPIVKITGSGTRTMPSKAVTFCKQLVIDGPTVNFSGNYIYTILGTIERYNSSVVNATSGTVVFAGSSAQTIGGATGDFYGTNGLYRITINNSHGLTLASPTELKGGLTLTSGLINTSVTNPLLISATGNNVVTPSAGSSTSYVNGPLTKSIVDGDYFSFPLGKDGVWGNKLKVSNSLSGTLNWTAEFFTPNSTYNDKSGSMSAVDSKGYYKVSASAAGSSTINVSWDAQSDVTPLVTANGLSDMRVAHFNTTDMKWEEVASTSTGNNTAGTSSTLANESFGASAYGHYTLGSVNTIKPKAKFNSGTSVCGLTTGIPISIVSSIAVPFNYSLTYSINGVAQTPITITSLPYTLPTLVAGDYKLLSFTYNNGTKTGVVDPAVVSVYATPTVANANSDQSLCGLTSATLNANSAVVGSGLWSVVSGTGGSFVAPTVPNTTFDGTNGTTYTLRWTISNGTCTSTDDMVVSFPLLPVQPSAFTQSRATVCQGEQDVQYVVPAIAGVDFHWSYSGSGVGLTFTDNAAVLDFASNATSGQLEVYTSNGCGNSASRVVNITVNPSPNVTLLYSGNSLVCQGDGLSFSTTNSGEAVVSYEYFSNNVSVGTTASSSFVMQAPVSDFSIEVVGTALNGCAMTSNQVDISVNTQSGVWTGAVDNDWFNVNNWCNRTVPTISDNVQISGTTNNPKVSDLNSIAYANNLTIGNGYNLDVLKGCKLTVNGSFVNNGQLILEHSTESSSSFIYNGTGTLPNVKVSQTFNGESLRKWYVGHVITESSYADYTANVSAPVSSNFAMAYYITPGWSNVTGGNVGVPMKGYGVQFRNVPALVEHTGSLFDNTDRSTTLVKAGYHLVANPYPSYLDLASYTTQWDFSALDKSVWVFTGYGVDRKFAAYNLTTGISTPAGVMTNYIAPLQGFFVSAPSTNATFVIKKGAKSHGAGGSLKAGSVSSNDILRISLVNSTSSDETVVVFREIGSATFSGQLDTKKFTDANASIPFVYSIKNNEQVAINLMPEDPTPYIVPLGMSVGNTGAGSITLKAKNIGEFLPDVDVLLYDKVLGDTINLREKSEYTFTSAAVTNQNRFELSFKAISKSPEVTTGIGNNAAGSDVAITAIGIGQKAIVKVKDAAFKGNVAIEVLDATGKLYQSVVSNTERTEVPVPSNTQFYIVKVAYNGVVKSFKIMNVTKS